MNALPAALAGGVVLLAAHQSQQEFGRIQNADLLYLPMLFQDLVLDGGQLSNWVLTPSPYLFPDFLLYCLIAVFSRATWVLAAAPALLLPVALVGAVHVLSTRLQLEATSRWFSVLLSVGLLLYAEHRSDTFAPFVVLSSHGGAALLVVVCLAMSTWRRPLVQAATLVCCVLGSMSDPLFAFAAAPALAVIFWSMHSNRLLATASVFACALGLKLRAALPVSPQLSGLFNRARTAAVLDMYRTSIVSFEGRVMVFAWVLSAVLVFVAWHQRRARVVALAALSSCGATLVSLWLVGAPTQLPDSRYLAAHSILLVLLVSMLLAVLGGERLAKMAVVLCSLFAAERALHYRAMFSSVGTLKPAPVACMTRFKQETPVHRCVAGYWASKPLMLGPDPVVALQVKPDGSPNWFINTRRGFAQGGPIDCAVFLEADDAVFVSRFGNGTRVMRCDGFVLRSYDGEDKRRLNEMLLPLLEAPVTPAPFF
jgi:hypothetical protein